MIGLVIGSAIWLEALRAFGVVFAVILLVIMLLVVCGARAKRWTTGLVLWTWATALAVSLQLSFSYGWALPLFGVVPGLPDDFVLRPGEIFGLTAVVVGSALSLISLTLGTFIQKIVCLPPAMLLLVLLYSFVVSVVL
jgi:hypothetical protein